MTTTIELPRAAAAETTETRIPRNSRPATQTRTTRPPTDTNHSAARARVAPLLSSDLLDLVDAYVREVAVETMRAELARATVDSRRREWYTVKEAARRLGISDDAVRMRARRNRLTFRHQGRTLYIAARSVDDLA